MATIDKIRKDIEKNNDDSTEQLLQLSGKTVTVSDVINSSDFKSALKSEVGNNIPTFSINFETGQLEYK